MSLHIESLRSFFDLSTRVFENRKIVPKIATLNLNKYLELENKLETKFEKSRSEPQSSAI